MYIKTEAIVLREVDINEADKLLDLLSKDQGLLTVKARGVRRSNSPLRSACQFLVLSEYTLQEYRGRYTVQEAVPLEQFQSIRRSLNLLALGTYFAQAAGTVAQADAPNPELLSLLCNAIYAMGSLKKPEPLVKAAFELRLACLAGFTPNLEACPVCGSETPDRFDLSQGTVTCAGCREGRTGIRLPINAGMLMALRYIVWCDPKRLFSFRLDDDSLREFNSLTEGYLMTQLEHSFYTLDFYKSLLQIGETL